MSYTAPTVAQFQSQFIRDFPYGTDPNTSVLDQDITNAFNMVDYQINSDFFPDQNSYNMGYLYLAAHFLVLNLRNSSQGLSGQYTWLQQSKSVGGVSEGFAIPQRVLDNPDFAMFFKTSYGAMYFQMVWPNLSGQMFAAYRGTQP